MNTKNIISLLLLCGILIVNYSCQNSGKKKNNDEEYLQGLTKASEKDLGKQDIMFDGESFPVYNKSGERIKGEKMMEFMMSGNYIPDFYVDENKKVKVAILRDVTEDEKNMMKEMQTETINDSELIGKDAFPFYVEDINGNEYSLTNLKGKIIVMNFWFVECKPCVMEIPDLNELVKKYEGENLVFLGFATNDTSRINSFLEKKEFSYNIIPNSSNVAKDYNVSGYPTHIVIDRNSKIEYLTSGLSPTTISDIENTIEHLLEK